MDYTFINFWHRYKHLKHKHYICFQRTCKNNKAYTTHTHTYLTHTFAKVFMSEMRRWVREGLLVYGEGYGDQVILSGKIKITLLDMFTLFFLHIYFFAVMNMELKCVYADIMINLR